MGCPSQCILGQNLTFTVQCLDGTGTPTTPTGNVTYAVYEDTTTVEILTGNMTADFDSKTGFCLQQIACTAANGFEQYKSYSVRIAGTVSTTAVAKSYNFLCLAVGDYTVTATTGALTTTANFKTYADISHADDDTLIASLIARATSAIQEYCDRYLISDTFREIRDGDGDVELFLEEVPVTNVALLSVGTQNVLRIKNTSSDAYNAYVKIVKDSSDNSISSTMTCGIQGGANDGTDDLTLSSYTITTLVAAIVALAKGWEATLTVSTWGVWNATELLPCSNRMCLDGYAYVQTPYKSEDDFEVDEDVGYIYLGTGFTKGRKNIIIRYTAGYSTTPADLEQICIDLVNVYYRSRTTDSTIKSERLADHAITYSEEGGGGARNIPSHIQKRLIPYKKWSRHSVI